MTPPSLDRLRARAAPRVRAALDALATRSPGARRGMAGVGGALVRAVERVEAKARYDSRYFGEGRDPGGDRQGRSGYATYDRLSSNADIAAYVLWRTFGGARRVLDVGCATGFVVEALVELGLDAVGCDVSEYAVSHATAGASGRLQVADLLAGLPWADREFDLVSVLETLEHLPPEQVAIGVRELRRVCRGYVFATMPSFGPSGGPGPDGFFDNKVAPDRLEHYRSLGGGYDGPVPIEDLACDSEGQPLEGHLTIASFRWWTERFAEVGMERRTDVEARIHKDIAPAGLAPWWNLYVFAAPEAPYSLADGREPERSLVDLGLRHPLFAGS